MASEDRFLSIVSVIPSLSKSIATYDDILLSESVLEGGGELDYD